MPDDLERQQPDLPPLEPDFDQDSTSTTESRPEANILEQRVANRSRPSRVSFTAMLKGHFTPNSENDV